MGRTKSEFVVVEMGIADSDPGPARLIPKLLRILARGLDNSEHARRWIKEHGEVDKQYQIATFRGGPVTVELTPITRRKLVDAAQAEDPRELDLDD